MDIIDLIGTDSSLLIPPTVPYRWDNGAHDIELTPLNAPLVAMAWVHEGGTPPGVKEEEFDKIRLQAEGDNASDADYAAWESAQCMRLVHDNWGQYSNWYLILVACYQVRELNDANLLNFSRMFSSRPLPPRTVSFLAYWASQQVKLVEDHSLRNKFVSNKFFERHTTASSTPRLCVEALDKATGLGVFAQSEETKIRKAFKNKHDLKLAQNLSTITLVKVSAVHEAAGTLPDVWYMGNKAVARFSGKKYSALVKYLKAIFKIQTNTDQIDKTTYKTMINNYRGGMQHVEINRC